MTRVKLKFTGEIWDRMHGGHLDYEFSGTSLRDLLRSLFVRYPLQDLILDDAGNIRTRSRVTVNGRFSDTLLGMATLIAEGDVIVLMRPGLGAT